MRHSALTNRDDLHYAKVRLFTGNPAVIAPDFIDQLLIASDTNKLYRATSTNAGGLTPLVAVPDGSGNGGSIAITGEGTPQTPPTAIGETYFDYSSGVFWCSVNQSGNPAWMSSVPPIVVGSVSESISELQSVFPDASGYFTVYHQTGILPVPQTIEINTFNQIGSASSGLEALIAQHGQGAYAFGFELNDPNSEVSIYQISITPSLGVGQIGSTDKILWIDCQATYNGKPCGGFLYVGRERRLGVSIDFSLSLQGVS